VLRHVAAFLLGFVFGGLIAYLAYELAQSIRSGRK
jgi:hypothetical protein